MDKAALAAIGDTLREGQRLRVSHGCGDGKTMLVSREGAKVRGWCFRCNEGEYADLSLSITDNLFRVRQSLHLAADQQLDGSAEQPFPLLSFEEWPAAARLWFLKAGLSGNAAGAMGAGWHEAMHRVVMPLRDRTGEVRSWTARSVDNRTPKYLTGFLPEGFVAELHGGHGDDPPVVVEDWLFANKLARANIHVVCMLGTYPKPATLARLLEFKEVFVWLDNDLPPKYPKNWGQIMAARVARTIRAYGVRVHNIAVADEPKTMDRWALHHALARSAEPTTTSVPAQDGESDEREQGT
jgi:hypothetical protein